MLCLAMRLCAVSSHETVCCVLPQIALDLRTEAKDQVNMVDDSVYTHQYDTCTTSVLFL